MQINLTPIVTIIIVVALILLFGSDRLLYFWRDLQKAWADFRGVFRRKARDERDSNI